MTAVLVGRRDRADASWLAFRPATVDDRAGLAAMLSDLSSRSRYERFFVGGFRVTDRALDRLLCLDVVGRAFVATEGERVVGHAMWAAGPAGGPCAEIAFVVAEDRRRRGVATRLTRLALADALATGNVCAEATVLASNVAAQGVVRRVLPGANGSSAHGEIAYAAPLGAGWRDPELSAARR